MANKFRVQFPWPVNGLARATAYSDPESATTLSANNVRSVDAGEGRVRGGSRPGLVKETDQVLGSGNPIRMLNRVATVSLDGTGSGNFRFIDDFARDALGSAWTTGAWATDPVESKAALDGAFVDNDSGAVVCRALDYVTSSSYAVEMYILPWDGQHWGTYELYLRMDDTTPNVETDGVKIALTLSGTTGVYSGSLSSFVGGVETSYALATGNTTTARGAWLRAMVSTDTIVVTYAGVQLISQAVSAHTGKRVGFGMDTAAAWPTGICLVDAFRVLGSTTTSTAGTDYTEYVAAISNGSLAFRNNLDVFAAATGAANDFSSDRSLQSGELFQKLYIADYGACKARGSDGVVASSTSFTSATYADFEAVGVDKDTDVVVITSGTGATAGTYLISAVTAGTITLASSPGDSTACVFRIARAPKVFDPLTGAVTIHTATAGQVPNECPLVAIFQDRVVYGGAPYAPQAWYMSAIGDPNDWDYSTTADGRAIAGTSDTGAGTIGLPLTAMFAASNDYLVMASRTSLHVLRGDPSAGGRFDTLSRRIGIIGPNAWCRGPENETYFLSRDGLYLLPPGEVGEPKAISRPRLPMELLSLDTTAYEVVMAYNLRQQGIHIFITAKSGYPSAACWFFDTKRAAFWPESYSSTMEVFSALALQEVIPTHSEILLGCRDGYLRRFCSMGGTDDGTAIASYCYMPPALLSTEEYNEGQLLELDGIKDRESGDVAWTIYVGDTVEDAWRASAFTTGTWAATSRQYRARPMARGGALLLKFANGDNIPWTIEKAFGVSKACGRHRL